MTLDQLRIFLEVARQAHVTRAAEILNLTQSAVSASITALERNHGVRLFDRIGRGISLTAEGRAFVREAETVILSADQAAQRLADMLVEPSGPLRIAASQTIASYWLPSRLMTFLEAFPNVEPSLLAGNTETVAKSVLAGEADLGIVEGLVTDTKLTVQKVATDPIAVVVGQRHPWKNGMPITAQDLLTSAWILREKGSGTRADFENWLEVQEMDIKKFPVLMSLPSNEACVAAVRGSLAATVLSRRAVVPHLGNDLHEVNINLPARRFSVLGDPRRQMSRAVKELRNLLQFGVV